MLADETVELDVSGRRYTKFTSLEIVSDLYSPSGSWRLELGAMPDVEEGARIEIHVNGMLEMTGIVDRIEDAVEGNSASYAVTGRTLMGLVEDSAIVDWSAPPSSLKATATRYLRDIPYVKECKVLLEDPTLDAGEQHRSLDVGDTVFQLLNEYAQNRGLLFWMKPDGTIVFGKAISSGAPSFRIDASKTLRSRRFRDRSKMHSQIIVVSDLDGHHKTTVSNETIKLRKPFAAAFNGPVSGLERQAKNYLRQEKMGGFGLEYVVPGYSQAGANWKVNAMVHVQDERRGIDGDFVLYRRTFRLDRASGRTTTLSLGAVLEDPFKAYPRKRRRREEG